MDPHGLGVADGVGCMAGKAQTRCFFSLVPRNYITEKTEFRFKFFLTLRILDDLNTNMRR